MVAPYCLVVGRLELRGGCMDCFDESGLSGRLDIEESGEKEVATG